MRWPLVRICVYYLLMVAVGLVLGTVYTGSPDVARWPQDVRTAVAIVPAGVLFFMFVTVGL